MGKMCINFSMVVLLLCLVENPLKAREVQEDENQWTDITDAVFSNITNTPGWELEENGHVFQNDKGNLLKVISSRMGTFIIDLQTGHVFFSKNYLNETMCFLAKRDNGFSIIVKTSHLKCFIRMTQRLKTQSAIRDIRSLHNEDYLKALYGMSRIGP